MHILFLGDVVGRTGREAVAAALPKLRATLAIDLAIVNAENASHGFGLAPEMARDIFAAGADVITLGNHAWDRKELIPYIAETPRLIRPANFPPGKYLRVTVTGGHVSQNGQQLAWDTHGYYEISLDEGSLTVGP